MDTQLTVTAIQQLFGWLNEELAAEDIQGEVYLVGGAVMCLALDARASTRDVDAVFKPTAVVRAAAARVALRAGVPATWLNDAVKGYLSPRGEFTSWLALSHLHIYVARPEYLLAMKCAAMRLGAEFYDEDDVRYLLRALNLTTVDEALDVVTRYFDATALPAKTRLALEEMLGPAGDSPTR